MKMRKKISFILGTALLMLFCLSSLSGCLFLNFSRLNNDDQIRIDLGEKVFAALDNSDGAALKKLFSKNAIAEMGDFETSASELFEYYDGKVESYAFWGGYVEDYVSGGKKYKLLDATFDVKTSEDDYRIFMEFSSVDTFDEGNEGIRSFYIIKANTIPI